MNKIKICARSILGKTLKVIKENLNKSHTMMMNLRVNIKNNQLYRELIGWLPKAGGRGVGGMVKVV